MKPALFQLFSSYSEHDFTSVDLPALASSIISAKDESPADFVFQYEKDFVRKVNKNQQKLSELNNSIEDLTKKLSVISRKQEKDRNSIKANHADVIAKTVDHDLQFNTANEKNSLIIQRLNDLERDFDVAKFAIFSNQMRIKTAEKSMNDNYDSLKNELKDATKIIHDILDEHEQYSRRAILELHGVPFNRKNDDTNQIAIDIFAAMGIQVQSQDLDRSHRQFIPRRYGRNQRSPIILVKFVSHDLRDLIYSNRYTLRNMPGFRHIYINENLTKVRKGLFKEVRQMKEYESWTYDGKIYMRHKQTPNVKHVITTRDDFEAVMMYLFP